MLEVQQGEKVLFGCIRCFSEEATMVQGFEDMEGFEVGEERHFMLRDHQQSGKGGEK